MAQITGQPAFEVFPESETTFFWRVVDAQFTIQKNKEGKVEGLLFEQGAVKLKARRISNELPREVELPEPEDVIESPRLVTLAKELKNGNRAPSQSSGMTCRIKAHSLSPSAVSTEVVGDVRVARQRQDAEGLPGGWTANGGRR